MNTSALKSFAPAVRRQLMEAVERRLDSILATDTPDLREAADQVANLRRQAEHDRPALIDRVAYTWFNRLAALRFLDARDWHPFRARVLTAASAEETQPEILRLIRTGALPAELKPHTDSNRLNDILDGRIPSSDAQTEVYRHLILATCRFYHDLLPNLFEKPNDETEFLLPDDLLTATSVAEGFRTEISDADCGDAAHANVELLGWLYQFYISEKKDAVMARKSAVPTEDIPAVTQLFTPHWIVRYLVENSLGRLWLLNRPGSGLRKHMPYFIEGENETDFLKITKPEEIRLCDPAVGSGHMLTYSFDLLTLIYEEEGYAPTEIPALILRHNLRGLEICPRAAQLAELALVFKARQASRRFFQPDHLVRPHIIELRDIRFEEGELKDYIQALGLGSLFNQPVLKLLHQFEEAKNFGSLIQPCLGERDIQELKRAIEAKDLGGQLFLRETHLKVLRVLAQAEALTERYHVVVANPPYMGGKLMNSRVKEFAKSHFPDANTDLFAAFIERSFALAVRNGYSGMITMQSWMFLSSFEGMRKKLLQERCIISMAHLGARGFDSIAGEVVQTTAFVIQNESSSSYKGVFLRLVDGENEAAKATAIVAAIQNHECAWLHRSSSADFGEIPGSPIAYWVSEKVRDTFLDTRPLADEVIAKQGLATGDNSRFLRSWSEVSLNKISFTCQSLTDSETKADTWAPYSKGGEFRKWFGCNEHVVFWKNGGEDIRNFTDENGNERSRFRAADYYFKPAMTWGLIASEQFSVRFRTGGFVFDIASMSAFSADDHYYLGLLNSKFSEVVLRLINPTLNYQIGDIKRIPLPKSNPYKEVGVGVSAAISLSKEDWDNFETSWDFRDQPLLRPGLKGATLEASWRNWEAQSTAAIRRMQELETENNRLFIAAYGLEGELQPEVPEAQITLARAEARRDMAAFLSYAVGCMMGRYSPDRPGLILANAGDTLREFFEKVGKPLAELTFAPDEDGIIPVLDGEWFEDDIVARTRDFLRATFGEATLNENLRFIEGSLGKPLDKYFLTDFYKDHLQTYKKRPIYWLFASPKRGFSALVYLHRYNRDTCNTLLNNYLRPYLKKLEARLAHLTEVEATSESARDKTAARKEAEKLRKTLKECQDWERDSLLPLAQQRIPLDLDDGVKVNYQKFPNALVTIPGLAAKED